jgi:signal transduction histidine kinase
VAPPDVAKDPAAFEDAGTVRPNRAADRAVLDAQRWRGRTLQRGKRRSVMQTARQDGRTTQTHASSARLTWMLVGVMVLVVLSFISVYFVARARARVIGRDIDAIVLNAMPSVEALTIARGDARRLDTRVREYADSVVRGEPRDPIELREPDEPRDPIDIIGALRTQLDGALAQYFELPMFPGEHALGSGVTGELSDLDRAIASVEQNVALHDVDGAQNAKRDEIRQAERLDYDLERLVNLNATQGQRLGLSVDEARSQTEQLARSLDTLAAVLALLATGIAVLTMRRMVRSLEIDRELAAQRAWALGERSAELDQFAGRMAHDVLSPLNSVSLALEFLRRRVAGDTRIETTVARALASLQRVRLIVDGLLEFARAGARPEGRATADLGSVVDDVIEGAQPEAVEAGVHLVAEPFAACRLACSPGVLTSLCANLVQNAIRHMNGSGERMVIVRVKEIDGHRRVEIDDTGPGVPPELEETLFDPFVRARGHDPGVGLGLATVRRLAQGHGGQVGFRSKDEGGSIFWFDLAVATAEAADPRPA